MSENSAYNENLCTSKVKVSSKGTGIERRMYTRNRVTNGPLYVYWFANNGSLCRGDGIDVSLVSILFDTHGIVFDAETINEIEYPHLSISLKIKKAKIIQRNVNKIVAIIDDFHQIIEDQKRWIEVLFRSN